MPPPPPEEDAATEMSDAVADADEERQAEPEVPRHMMQLETGWRFQRVKE